VAGLIALVAGGAASALARDAVPLPKPRPAEAPATPEPPPEAEAPDGAAGAGPQASEPQQPEPKPPSACRLALTDKIAVAPSIPDITGPGGCGGPDLVRLEAIVMPDGSRVAVTPAATLRCPMAAEIADWVRGEMAPLAATLGSRIADLDNFDSYECRGRNRVRGAKLSEHGRANALDVRGLKLTDGRMIGLTDREVPRQVRETVLQSVCARFTTVLGPGSDGYHEDHIHLDLAERRGGYRICHWELYEQMPQIAPLLPAERPAEAPPREQAAGEDQPPDGQGVAAPTDAAPPAAETAPEPAEPPPPAKPRARTRHGKPLAAKPARPAAAKPGAARDGKAQGGPVVLIPPGGKPATKKRRDDRRF